MCNKRTKPCIECKLNRPVHHTNTKSTKSTGTNLILLYHPFKVHKQSTRWNIAIVLTRLFYLRFSCLRQILGTGLKRSQKSGHLYERSKIPKIFEVLKCKALAYDKDRLYKCQVYEKLFCLTL